MAEIAKDKPQQPKRFYKEVTLGELNGGFRLLLDGREAKTPARNILTASTPLAEAIRDEWEAQSEFIDFLSMPLTRLQMTVLDADEEQVAQWRTVPKEYLGTDLLAYRADQDKDLALEQARVWDPICDAVADETGVHLAVTEGVMPVSANPESEEALTRTLEKLSPQEALVTAAATQLTGSVVLGLALLNGAAKPEVLFDASVLDAVWQEKRWGEDAEALERRDQQRQEFMTIARFLALVSSRGN